MYDELSNLQGKIERENARIQWAINNLSLDLKSKRIFVNRRLQALRQTHEELRQFTRFAAGATEIVPAVKLPVSPIPQWKGPTMKSRETMAQERKNAQLSYATWLYAVTKLPPGQSQIKVATSCFRKLQGYSDELKEIVGEREAEKIIGEIFAEVHQAATEMEREGELVAVRA